MRKLAFAQGDAETAAAFADGGEGEATRLDLSPATRAEATQILCVPQAYACG